MTHRASLSKLKAAFDKPIMRRKIIVSLLVVQHPSRSFRILHKAFLMYLSIAFISNVLFLFNVLSHATYSVHLRRMKWFAKLRNSVVGFRVFRELNADYRFDAPSTINIIVYGTVFWCM